jgi:hypothetical protein
MTADAGAPPPPVPAPNGGDTQQIFQALFDPTNTALRCVVIGASSANHGTDLSWDQVIARVYDPATNKLRVVTT